MPICSDCYADGECTGECQRKARADRAMTEKYGEWSTEWVWATVTGGGAAHFIHAGKRERQTDWYFYGRSLCGRRPTEVGGGSKRCALCEKKRRGRGL